MDELQTYISYEEKLASYLVRNLIRKELSPKEEKVIVYGWSIVLINLAKMLVIAAIALLTGMFQETFLAFITYTILRIHAYGYHAKKSLNCTLIGVATFNLIPMLLVYMLDAISVSEVVLKSSLFMVFLINLFLLYKYCPARTQRKDNRADDVKKRNYAMLFCTILAFVALLFFSGVNTVMIFWGMTLCTVFITPLCVKTIKEE